MKAAHSEANRGQTRLDGNRKIPSFSCLDHRLKFAAPESELGSIGQTQIICEDSEMTSDLVLRELTAQDETSFLEGLATWPEEDRIWHSFEWLPEMKFSELLEGLQKNKLGFDIPAHFVPSTMLYGFKGTQIIGRVHLRHLLNENLLHRGGHIGYAVAPPFRRFGYANQLLGQALPIVRSLGISRALLTCDDDNKGSWKVIERWGGSLEDKRWDDEDKTLFRRYWIQL